MTRRLEAVALVRSPPRARWCESPASWLTSEQNERLAQHHAAGGAPGSLSSETEAAVDARAGWKAIEIFVALLPVGWG